MAAISTMAGAASTHSSRLDPYRVVERRIRPVSQRCCCRAHWASRVAARSCGQLGHRPSLAAMRSRSLNFRSAGGGALTVVLIRLSRRRPGEGFAGRPDMACRQAFRPRASCRCSRIRVGLSAGSSDNVELCGCFRIARSRHTTTWRRQLSPPPCRTSVDRQVGGSRCRHRPA